MVEESNNKVNPDVSGVIRSVVAFVRDRDDRVLLASHSEDGPWSFLGGPVNVDESLEQAANRILFEDCGIKVALGRMTVQLEGEEYRALYECGQDVTWRATVFEATLTDDAVKNAPMMTRWFTTENFVDVKLDEFATTAARDLGLT